MRKWISYASSSNWLRVVGVATILLLGCYVMVQQSIRLGACYLPLTTAETIKHQLESGQSPRSVIPKTQTDLRSDSTIFVIITNSNYHIIACSAVLDGNTSLPPVGTFQTTQAKASDRFTWQPEANVRLAVEMLPYSSSGASGYVIAGQSLKESEKLINHIGWITLVTWLGVVVWATFIPVPYGRKK